MKYLDHPNIGEQSVIVESQANHCLDNICIVHVCCTII